MTLTDKINLLCNHSQKDDDVVSLIEAASSFFLNSLPLEIAKNFYVNIEITSNGIKCPIKKASVFRDGIRCREIEFYLVKLAKDENSAYYATKYDPVYYYDNGIIYVLPEPNSNEKAYVNTIPNINISISDENISYLSEDTEPIVLLYSAFLILTKEYSSIKDNISDIIDTVLDRASSFQNDITQLPSKIESNIDFTFPQAPDVSIDLNEIDSIIEKLETEFDDVDLDLTINIPDFSVSYSGVIPEFEMPSIEEPVIDIEEATNALQNAGKYIGDAETDKLNSPKGSFWLKDEDPEMVASSVQLANTEIQRASGFINTQIGQINVFKESINAKYTEFKAKLDAFQSEVQFKIQDVNAKIQSFNAELQAKLGIVNSKIQKIQTEIAIGKYQLESEVAAKQHEINVAKANLEQKVSSISTQINKYQAEVQSAYYLLNMKLQDYSLKVNENIQFAQLQMSNTQMILADINHLNASLQGELSKFNIVSNEATSMYQRYQNEYINYLSSLGYDFKADIRNR